MQHEHRDEIIKELQKKKIYLNISYPWPIHIMEPYKKYVKIDCLDNTNIYSKKIFSLPMYPELSKQKQMKVIKELRNIIKKLN